MAQIQTVVFLFGIIGVTGTWDGLVRRHIRLSFDALGMFVLWRGIPAILVGLVSLLLLLFIGGLEAMVIRPVIAACHVMTCTVQQTVLVLFTTWQSIVTVGLFGFLFAYWLWGAFDLQGPTQACVQKCAVGNGNAARDSARAARENFLQVPMVIRQQVIGTRYAARVVRYRQQCRRRPRTEDHQDAATGMRCTPEVGQLPIV